jgi:hypothetical protein
MQSMWQQLLQIPGLASRYALEKTSELQEAGIGIQRQVAIRAAIPE